MWTIPNALTFLRILLIPVVVIAHARGFSNLALLTALTIPLTDFLDGHLARRFNQVSAFGAIFDPIADRLVAIGLYGYLALVGVGPTWFLAIVLTRNVAQILSVPILVWWLKRRFAVNPKALAKWATALSDLYLCVLLFFPMDGHWLYVGGLFAFQVGLASVELWILATYLPRLVQIAMGKHDTFE